LRDDAGSLLVRAGLIEVNQLGAAKETCAQDGGTIAEHLVLGGHVDDEELTEFYSETLMVPRVNASALTKIPDRLLELIPKDMAAEFRVVPVSLDAEQNLTLAMSDPSQTRAADEIGFFTGAYVVRAVATQAQIAWCLAHYYGHVTPLGESLVADDETEAEQDDALDASQFTDAPEPGAVQDLIDEPSLLATGPTAPVPVQKDPEERDELMPRVGEINANTRQDRAVEELPRVVLADSALIATAPAGSAENPVLLTRNTVRVPRVHETPLHAAPARNTDTVQTQRIPRTTQPIPVDEQDDLDDPSLDDTGEVRGPPSVQTPLDDRPVAASGEIVVSAASKKPRARTDTAVGIGAPSAKPLGRRPIIDAGRIPHSPIANTTRIRRRASTNPPMTAPSDIDASSERLLATLRQLDRVEDRDAVIETLLDHVAARCGRVAFFTVKGDTIKLFAVYQNGVNKQREGAPLSLDSPSILRDVVDTRLPFHGELLDETTRLFLEQSVEHVPADILLAPVAVRGKIVGMAYGDSFTAHLFRDHLAAATRAAGLALERVLKIRRSRTTTL